MQTECQRRKSKARIKSRSNNKKEKTCSRHPGVNITYNPSQYEDCPLCIAEDKLADYEIID